nr:putative protein TPRXL [Penaeus vannamei]
MLTTKQVPTEDSRLRETTFLLLLNLIPPLDPQQLPLLLTLLPSSLALPPPPSLVLQVTAIPTRTPTHSRAESGDADNNVDGNFAFVADDGQSRAISYEAGSDTGFIAEGAHIPVGPEVPGAPSDTNADASYSFAFDSDQYSRSESADADGNVQGTYTLLDDQGTRRTYRFRAGKGVGFEKEQVSASRGASPFRSSSPSSSAPTLHSPSSPSTYTASTASSPRYPSAAASTSSSSAGGFRSTSGPGFQLRQYDATKNPHKVGYVLTFDN